MTQSLSLILRSCKAEAKVRHRVHLSARTKSTIRYPSSKEMLLESLSYSPNQKISLNSETAQYMQKLTSREGMGAHQAGPVGDAVGVASQQRVVTGRKLLIVRVGSHPQLLGGKRSAAGVLIAGMCVHRRRRSRHQLPCYRHPCPAPPLSNVANFHRFHRPNS